jgi:hypothetical protein
VNARRTARRKVAEHDADRGGEQQRQQIDRLTHTRAARLAAVEFAAHCPDNDAHGRSGALFAGIEDAAPRELPVRRERWRASFAMRCECIVQF